MTTPPYRVRFLRTRHTGRPDTVTDGYFEIELMAHIHPPNLGQVSKMETWEILELRNHDSRHEVLKAHRELARHTTD